MSGLADKYISAPLKPVTAKTKTVMIPNKEFLENPTQFRQLNSFLFWLESQVNKGTELLNVVYYNDREFEHK